MIYSPPKIIAFCGPPSHGKSTAQSILERHGITPIDDSLAIRKAGMQRWGLSLDDVSSQSGKLREIEAFGRIMTIREALGLLGYEGESIDCNFWLEETLRSVRASGSRKPVSFGSIRMWQGHTIKRCDGLLLEIVNPAKPGPKHFFDHYDRSILSATIVNDGSFETLEEKLLSCVTAYLSRPTENGLWD